jgi:hypothetical protein
MYAEDCWEENEVAFTRKGLLLGSMLPHMTEEDFAVTRVSEEWQLRSAVPQPLLTGWHNVNVQDIRLRIVGVLLQ